MKLLCSESNAEICGDIVARLEAAGIAAELRSRSPSLFDQASVTTALHEIWVVNDDDFERANTILYDDQSDLQHPHEGASEPVS